MEFLQFLVQLLTLVGVIIIVFEVCDIEGDESPTKQAPVKQWNNPSEEDEKTDAIAILDNVTIEGTPTNTLERIIQLTHKNCKEHKIYKKIIEELFNRGYKIDLDDGVMRKELIL